ncbi:MAG: molybdate ABC transporter permease subunit, partial [Synechococcaceae cyanobacterium RL_1_2]|nr:molybdate ABC transporter permease subunit [Synechococcaceae cyanobacterium RL_1_2]
MLSFARALGEFGATLMIAGNIPHKTQTIPLAIYVAAESGEMATAAGWVMIMVAISFGVMAIVAYTNNPRGISGQTILGKGAIWLSHGIVWLEGLLDHRKCPRGECRPNLSTKVDHPGAPPFGLQVNLRKQLQQFSLDVAFTADLTQPLGILGPSGSGKSMTLRCIA